MLCQGIANLRLVSLINLLITCRLLYDYYLSRPANLKVKLHSPGIQLQSTGVIETFTDEASLPQKMAHLMAQSNPLCLACSSSLPPSKGAGATINSIYMTKCCQRPICPSCISSNPRLARYDPCLACLGGIGVVASGSTRRDQLSPGLGSRMNLDGSVRDQDTFVLGDDDDDDEAEDSGLLSQVNEPHNRAPPPPYEAVDLTYQPGTTNPSPGSASDGLEELTDVQSSEVPLTTATTGTTPLKYYLNAKDTLQGISLRFGVDGYEVCKLNNLPLSVVRTTPHLLHTRAFVLLPSSAKPHLSSMISPHEQNEREQQLVRNRAEKKLQTLTKEVDWRVAKAYVALADDADEQEATSSKQKETGTSRTDKNVGSTSGAGGLEALAIQRYLDDEEWEAEQRRAGRAVKILPFPMPRQHKRWPIREDVVRWWDEFKN